MIKHIAICTKDRSVSMKRYQPKKQKKPVKAIREHCIECMGGRGSGQNTSKLIEECGSPDCALFGFRFGKNPNHTQNLTDAQRKERAERLKASPSHHKRTEKVAKFPLLPLQA